MRLKVLGAYGASDAEHNLTGYLIDWVDRSAERGGIQRAASEVLYP